MAPNILSDNFKIYFYLKLRKPLAYAPKPAIKQYLNSWESTTNLSPHDRGRIHYCYECKSSLPAVICK